MLLIISLIFLWLNPVIGVLLVHQTKKRLDTRQKMVRIFCGITIIVLVGLLTNISIAFIEFDWLLFGILHLSICFFIWLGWYHKKLVLMIVSLTFMIPIFLIGYILSTVGILGLGFITAEYEPSKSLRINNNTVYKEYRIGNAISSTRGVNVCLYRNYYWFPLFERKFFSKKYIESYKEIKNQKNITPENSAINNTPSFYALSFNLKYDTKNQEIILSNEDSNDTLNLGGK